MVRSKLLIDILLAKSKSINGIWRGRDEAHGRARLGTMNNRRMELGVGRSSQSDRARGYKNDVVVSIKRHCRVLYSVNMDRGEVSQKCLLRTMLRRTSYKTTQVGDRPIYNRGSG